MNINFAMRSDESKATPIKIAEALISDSGLDTNELNELGEYLSTYARFARIKKRAERYPEEDF